MPETTTVQQTMLLRTIYVLFIPVFLVLAVLACAGTVLTGTPVSTCPTTTASSTAAVVMVATPLQTPTTHATADFYVGDAVTIGAADADVRVQFRLFNVASQPVSPDADGEARSLYTWQLAVTNLGQVDYTVFPSVQMALLEVTTAYGDMVGPWFASREAASAAGVTVEDNLVTLAADETRVFQFAAFGPEGEARRFAFQLDPTGNSSDALTWRNATNPDCAAEVSP